MGFGRSIIAVQVAIAVVLSTGSLGAVISLLAVLGQPRGFDATNVIMIDVNPGRDVKDLRAFYARVADALAQRPDVIAVSAATTTPFENIRAVERAEEPEARVAWQLVLPGYFEALAMRVREGRLPTRSDVEAFEPAVLSLSAARRLVPGRTAVGADVNTPEGRKATVIAVVDDEAGYSNLIGPSAYLLPRELRSAMTLVVKTRTKSPETLAAIRREIVTLVPPTEPVMARWMSEAIGDLDSYRRPRFQALLLCSFAGLALGLAWLGIVAIVSAHVGAQTRELGIRLALGARSSDVVRAVTWETAKAIAAGVLLGVLGSYLVQRIARAHVNDFDPVTPATLAIAVAVVIAAGLLAAALPARRAGRVDPLIVLRSE
jgi:putative ABC transport system permease protein